MSAPSGKGGISGGLGLGQNQVSLHYGPQTDDGSDQDLRNLPGTGINPFPQSPGYVPPQIPDGPFPPVDIKPLFPKITSPTYPGPPVYVPPTIRPGTPNDGDGLGNLSPSR